MHILTDNCIIYLDNVVYAVQCKDDQWRRGIVMNIQEDSGTTNYTIHCIDYGSTVILTADRYIQ